MFCTTTVRPRRRRSASADTLAEMTESIRELAVTRGCATEDDLKAEGFTAAEIAKHGETARAAVRKLMNAAAG